MHSNYRNPALRAWFLSITAAATLFSNPVLPPEFTPITEIQVKSPAEWTIEVDLGNVEFTKPKTPYSTDTIMLDFINSSKPPSSVFMKKCTSKETVNTNNIVLLTEKHFPSLKIGANITIYLGIKGQDRTWTAPINQIPSNPELSLKYMYTETQDYLLSACPSLGTRNVEELKGRIEGTVRDKNLILISGIRVSCKPNPTLNVALTMSRTDSDGCFITGILDSCHTYSLAFLNDSGKQISSKVAGPFQIKPGTSIKRDIVLSDYAIPPVDVRHSDPGSKPAAFVRFLPSDNLARLIVLAVSGSPASQKGKLDIYTMNGLHIRSLTFICTGAGTYTIPWDGCNKRNKQVPGGSYVCRVKIGNEVLCKGIITN